MGRGPLCFARLYTPIVTKNHGQNAVPLAALAVHLAQRRDAVMKAWREAVTADPKLTTGDSLPRAQLHDHIPALLEDFERRLTANGVQEHAEAEDEHKGDAAAHGLHRWQQGFDLGEVTRELGRLNECVVAELESYGQALASHDNGAMAEARRIWAALYSVTLSASASQYFKLQKMEAASHVVDLEAALRSLRDLEARRAELWHQAAHDLRGNLGVVANATAGLGLVKDASGDARNAFLGMLQRNVSALQRLLEDVTSLARLQSGQERRSIAPMDATPLMMEVCESFQPMAEQQGLYLRCEGPQGCEVESDVIKTRRIVQNLVLNAVKYTREGGVTVSWGLAGGADAQRWFVQIADTGPGFHAGPGAKMVAALEVATDQARTMAADSASGDVTHVNVDDAKGHALDRDARPVHQQPGEGLGLSIVKRLCELLDATIELNSEIGVGTTFRVLLPRRYGG